MLKHCKFYKIFNYRKNDILTKWLVSRSFWDPVRGNGRHDGWVHRWVLHRSRRCLCHAPAADHCQCWSSRSSLPGLNVWKAQTSWQRAGDGWLVSLTSRLWMLAVCSRRTDIKIIRVNWRTQCRSRRWPSSKPGRSSCNGCLPNDPYELNSYERRAAHNNVKYLSHEIACWANG